MEPSPINGDFLEGLLNGTVPKEAEANVTQCQTCRGGGGDLKHAKICSECAGAAREKYHAGIVKLCLKCSGRGFALSRKSRGPACNAYKSVMNASVDTITRTSQETPIYFHSGNRILLRSGVTPSD
jgi:DnaJ-class molecular chaperone